MRITHATLQDAIAANMEPDGPDVLDEHPGHVLLNTTTMETWSLDPEDYRMFDGQPDDELRGAMETVIECSWHEALEADQQAVLVPEYLLWPHSAREALGLIDGQVLDTFFGKHPATLESVRVDAQKRWSAVVKLPLDLDGGAYADLAQEVWEALEETLSEGWQVDDHAPPAVHEERSMDGAPVMVMRVSAWLSPV